ncbi:DivIVA domain-containing protein [Propionimicrobium sp. PCR01-08-3]|uniref:DivIVA domain-containing protein n=1 Tax=Propionimicrobium sp. PCR01-08-3 TaxID=3052086 RepID=UPI00255CE294|nr:DivIVA domain-containing protein [Propionimicrobium sp. PCR01-08-3]WIY81801.1 DivIVA domain-containing protein [Propionimicrobium sp. PCR01-08-3]
MGWVFAALMIVIVGFIFFAATGRGGEMAPQVDDRPAPRVPSKGEPITAKDLDGLSFAVVTRGYSMEQVDAVLDRVSAQLDGTSDSSEKMDEGAPVDPELIGGVPNGWPESL